MKVKKQSIAAIAVAIVVLVVINKHTGKHPTNQNGNDRATTIEPQVGPQSKILSFALDRLEPKEYPILAKKLGDKRLNDARKGAQVAAWSAAKETACDAVELSSPIVDKSTKKHLYFFVNCRNLTQYHFSEEQLRDVNNDWYTVANVPAAGESTTEQNAREKAEREAKAPGGIRACENEIRSHLKFSSSANFNTLTGSMSLVDEKGNRLVSVSYTVKNDSGNEISQTAYCKFFTNGDVQIESEDH